MGIFFFLLSATTLENPPPSFPLTPQEKVRPPFFLKGSQFFFFFVHSFPFLQCSNVGYPALSYPLEIFYCSAFPPEIRFFLGLFPLAWRLRLARTHFFLSISRGLLALNTIFTVLGYIPPLVFFPLQHSFFSPEFFSPLLGNRQVTGVGSRHFHFFLSLPFQIVEKFPVPSLSVAELTFSRCIPLSFFSRGTLDFESAFFPTIHSNFFPPLVWGVLTLSPPLHALPI